MLHHMAQISWRKKLECINNVSKRLYDRLEKVKTNHKRKKLLDGKAIDGKTKLSIALMKELQMYYGKDIR